jgi:hypothetical protein
MANNERPVTQRVGDRRRPRIDGGPAQIWRRRAILAMIAAGVLAVALISEVICR